MRALDGLTETGARVSIHVSDLDREIVVLAGDDFVTYPVAGLGSVPILIETAAGVRDGRLDPDARVARESVVPAVAGGLWQRMHAQTLRVADLAALSAETGDPLATNALLGMVGLDAVRNRLVSMGFTRLAVLDGYRDVRGPDDAPHMAVGTTRDLARLMTLIVNGQVVDATVSAQVGEWLTRSNDLSLVGSATGLDPSAHDDDRHGLLFLNRTGHDDGVRSEAGVIAGPRAGVAYAMTVCFDDLSMAHRLRVHDAFRTFGVDLMEYVY
ncbi:serine hydrolase [Microbacterium gorillae]|uniref:serine hydrolase n=1 Tax=Microbacterium gorillae TaxID=1231063 RepID=UPI000A5EA3D0|nr:serine hydrolase [Microbacterium gorillae]